VTIIMTMAMKRTLGVWRGGTEDVGSGSLPGENHVTMLQVEVGVARLDDDDVLHRLHGQGGVTTGRVEGIAMNFMRRRRGDGEKCDDHM